MILWQSILKTGIIFLTILANRYTVDEKEVSRVYKLNISITEEAAEILKAKSKRYGTTMGAMVTMMLLEAKKQDDTLDSLAMYKAELEKQAIEPPA